MKFKLSQHTPRKSEGTTIIPKVSILTRIRKITLEDITEIYIKSNDIHLMRKDTLPYNVLETRETKEDIRRRRETKEEGKQKKTSCSHCKG